MIKEIICTIQKKGYLSIEQIAKELDIDGKSVSEIMSLLTRKGYLTQEPLSTESSSLCAGCTMKCSRRGHSTHVYRITSKGKEYAKL